MKYVKLILSVLTTIVLSFVLGWSIHTDKNTNQWWILLISLWAAQGIIVSTVAIFYFLEKLINE